MNDHYMQINLEHAEQTLAEIRRDLGETQSDAARYELRALQLLLEVTKALHSVRDMRTLMALVLDSALSFEAAERAVLLLLDASGEPRFKMGRTYAGDFLDPHAVVISSRVVQQTLYELQPIILADALNDARFEPSDSIISQQLRTIMTAPLRYEERIMGLIYVDSRRPLTRYTPHHLNVMASLAEQASIALYNARKFETLSD